MENFSDFLDFRYRGQGVCIHCGKPLVGTASTVDHVPSKVLLDQPLPPNVHTVKTCMECNNGFSSDEQYFAAFLGAVLSGSTDPEIQVFEGARRALSGNERLRREIEAVRRDGTDKQGSAQTLWVPDKKRIHRVVIKNARGHAFYELGRPLPHEPSHTMVVPKMMVDGDQLRDFLAVDHGSGWPEVGTRLFQRMLEGANMDDGWLVVQPSTYVVSAIEDSELITIRSVIREYLLTEVVWEI